MLFKLKGTKSRVLGASSSKTEQSAETPDLNEHSSTEEATPAKEKKSLKFKSVDWQLLLTNKKLVGFCCIGIATVATFVVTPLMQTFTTQPQQIVVASQEILFGQKLSNDNLTLTAYPGENIPQGAYRSIDDVLGKYANAPMFSNDVVTSQKIRSDYPSDDNYLAELPPDKLAISVTAKTSAASLSDKLRSGDIVSIYIIQKVEEEYVAVCPEELKAVEVLAVTNCNTQDISNGDSSETDGEERQISTITCIVNDTQAALLAAADSHGEIHAALRLRGNPVCKAQLLGEQEQFFEKIAESDAPQPEEQEAAPDLSTGPEEQDSTQDLPEKAAENDQMEATENEQSN